MILGFDGYEQYGPAGNEAKMLSVWSEMSMALSSTHVRTEPGNGVVGQSLKSSALGTRRISLRGSHTTVGWGMGLWMDNLPSVGNGIGAGKAAYCIQLWLNVEGYATMALLVGATGRLELWSADGFDSTAAGRGPPVKKAESTLEMAPGTFNHIESKIVLDNATGTCKVKVNGRTFIDFTGDTIYFHDGSSTIAQVASGLFNTSGAPSFLGFFYYDDDFWWNDATNDAQGHAGSVVDFLGQYGAYWLPPAADTADADFTLTSGINGYQLIDEIPPNEDTDFIFSSTPTNKSGFTTAALPANVTNVAACAPWARIKKTDTGTCDSALGLKSGATREFATDRAMTTSYGYFRDVFEKDSASTANPWNPATLPAILVKRTA